MNNQLMATVASACRIPIQRTHAIGGISDQIFAAIERDESLYLDCVDITLKITSGANSATLDSALRFGGSVWGVGADGMGLERRVPESAARAFDSAKTPGDSAAEELISAWAAAYGRNPDPSDSWDHAIKAVEELLIPLVVPKVAKANLGSVAGEIGANPTKWDFGLESNAGRTNGETLEGLLRLIWPNPDRHGGASKRAPTQDEAEAAVAVAVLIVNLCRGRLKRVS
jgi:hypothetical protein